MGIIAWIVVGLIAGYLARLALPGKEPGPSGIVGDLIVGVVGAIVGGWIFSLFGLGGVTGINVGSILIAFLGGVLFLLIWRAIAKGGHHPAPGGV